MVSLGGRKTKRAVGQVGMPKPSGAIPHTPRMYHTPSPRRLFVVRIEKYALPHPRLPVPKKCGAQYTLFILSAPGLPIHSQRKRHRRACDATWRARPSFIGPQILEKQTPCTTVCQFQRVLVSFFSYPAFSLLFTRREPFDARRRYWPHARLPRDRPSYCVQRVVPKQEPRSLVCGSLSVTSAKKTTFSSQAASAAVFTPRGTGGRIVLSIVEKPLTTVSGYTGAAEFASGCRPSPVQPRFLQRVHTISEL